MPKFFLCLVLAFVCHGGTMARQPSGRGYETVPYHVHMLIYDEYMSEWPASGVLVTRQHVLTAAVNVHNYNRWDLGFGSEKQRNLLLIKSFNAHVHELFNDTTDDNNIGLIDMPEPIEISDRIAPIALPQQNEHIPREGDIGHIAAYMLTSDVGPLSRRLSHGAQKIVSDGECVEAYPHLNGIIDHFFCGHDDHFNTCGGVQGSGLVVKQNGKSVLAGIVSFGSIWRDCDSHSPLGFVRISEYVDWIHNKTNGTASNDRSSGKNADNINMIGYLA